MSLGDLASEMGCAKRTVERTKDTLIDLFHAPLEYFPEQKGWAYNRNGDSFELPGVWLTSSDLQSLAALLGLIKNISPGLLDEEFSLVESQINKFLQARGLSVQEITDKIRYLPQATRNFSHTNFLTAGEAILKGRRLSIRYKSYNGQASTRELSPLTLVYYRENWFLDAWCHLRKAPRTFSLSRIEKCLLLEALAEQINKEQVEQYFAASYGIFSGMPKHRAELKFTGHVAREISTQSWHPQQQGEWQGDEYLLHIPYSDDRELIQEILRYTPHVCVEKPAALRKAVQSRLHAGLEAYREYSEAEETAAK